VGKRLRCGASRVWLGGRGGGETLTHHTLPSRICVLGM
jgi:hypothetical protein